MTPSTKDMVSIDFLGLPWIVTMQDGAIDLVSVNGHWLNAEYVLGAALIADLERAHAEVTA